jgi:hypothetical protein
MARYTSFAGSIGRIRPLGIGGYCIEQAARVPEPVAVIFRTVHKDSVTEVDWDHKTREAKLVPYWERTRS